ncbi:MAG: alanine racemase [Tepidanaerobacteraceae bacterium]
MHFGTVRPTREEINLDYLEHNFKEIRRITDKNATICAVLKSDGYGMGAYEAAKVLLSCGASYLAVAFLDEALALRNRGIDAPILILGYTPEEQFDKVIGNDLTQTVYCLKLAEKLSNVAQRMSKKAKIHIKIDSGMGRLGFQAQPLNIAEIKKLFNYKGLEIEGIYTHFAKADENDIQFTYEQFTNFLKVVNILDEEGFRIPIKHAANSAAIIQFPDTHLDMVRAGIILFGLYPDSVNRDKARLRPVMTFKTQVSCVKRLPKGRSISYGGIFITRHDSVVATLPVGYADGYSRRLSSRGNVIVKGKRAPIIGRICMDQCMIDVTHIEGVKIGDEVILIGSMGDETITVDDVANTIGTVRDEIVNGVSRRVPRVYKKNNKIIHVKGM